MPAPDVDYARVFHAAPGALIVIRADGLVMADANPAYLAAVGMSLADIAGKHVFDVFPNNPIREGYDQETDLRTFMRKTIDERQVQMVEAMRYDIPDSAGGFEARWWNVVEVPVFDESGDVTHLLHYTEDVTDLVLARDELAATERERDAAARRAASMAEVALALTTAQDAKDLEAIVITRGLGGLGSDGGGLVTPAADGGWRVIASETLGRHVQRIYGYMDRDSPLPGAYCARTGERLLFPTRASGLAYDPVMASVYENTERSGWAFLPLIVQGELLGSLAVAWVDEHEFRADELDVLDGFAAQCAQALHRIQLAQAQRAAARRMQELAEALQHAMLTPPQQTDDLRIAVRYRPAEAIAAVGGDWYDAFVQPDGATMLAIGDVCGHDDIAAAKMGQLRGLLRALAYDADTDGQGTPARILMRLENVSRGLAVDSLATAILARIEHQPGDPTRVLRWSNAGNPPPVLVHPDGSTTLLDLRSDLLLGVDPTVVRHDHVVRLGAGETFLMYTDGLIERRNASIDDGLADLRAAIGEFAAAPLDELCDGVLERLAPHIGEDDVAMIAVRAATDGGR